MAVVTFQIYILVMTADTSAIDICADHVVLQPAV